jgi:hypothetical protein
MRLGVATAVAAAALVASGVAAAGGGGTLSLTAFVKSDGTGFVQATFTNTGGNTLTHVVVSVDLGGATFSSTGSSAGCTGTSSGASCALGNVAGGGVTVANVAFTGGSTGTILNGTATWDAATVGKPKGTASGNTTSATQVTPTLVSAVASGCNSAASGGRGIAVTGNGCDNSIEGIDNSNIFFVKGVAKGQTATVTLTYPDEALPFSADDNFQGVFEYPKYPTLEPQEEVQFCDTSQNPEGWPTEEATVSTDSCIASIQSTDEGDSDSQDNDADAGTVTLHVTGTGSDPGYI